jgi:hypothetical protein
MPLPALSYMDGPSVSLQQDMIPQFPAEITSFSRVAMRQPARLDRAKGFRHTDVVGVPVDGSIT